MARAKIDGVIEAVRYSPEGLITVARGYERHGAVWTDNLLFPRDVLLQKLKDGRHFVTGVRKTNLGSVFNTEKEIHLQDDHILTDDQKNGRDLLGGVGIF